MICAVALLQYLNNLSVFSIFHHPFWWFALPPPHSFLLLLYFFFVPFPCPRLMFCDPLIPITMSPHLSLSSYKINTTQRKISKNEEKLWSKYISSFGDFVFAKLLIKVLFVWLLGDRVDCILGEKSCFPKHRREMERKMEREWEEYQKKTFIRVGNLFRVFSGHFIRDHTVVLFKFALLYDDLYSISLEKNEKSIQTKRDEKLKISRKKIIFFCISPRKPFRSHTYSYTNSANRYISKKTIKNMKDSTVGRTLFGLMFDLYFDLCCYVNPSIPVDFYGV